MRWVPKFGNLPVSDQRQGKEPISLMELGDQLRSFQDFVDFRLLPDLKRVLVQEQQLKHEIEE
jgi:hypothetical protein